MTIKQHIPILQFFSSDKSKSKGMISEKNLLQVCSIYSRKPERVIVNDSSTEEIELKSVHKSMSTNGVKDKID